MSSFSRWQKELKRIQEAVNNLNNARVLYKRRQQEYDRCREALRMAEQGAEIGATGENKVTIEIDVIFCRNLNEILYCNILCSLICFFYFT